MLFKETIININDNSGFIKAKIINFYKGSFATVGSFVYLAKKKVRKNTFLNEKKKLGIIIGTRFGVRRKSGIKVIHSMNSGLLIQDKSTLLGSRFLGPISLEIKNTALSKSLVFNRFFV